MDFGIGESILGFDTRNLFITASPILYWNTYAAKAIMRSITGSLEKFRV